MVATNDVGTREKIMYLTEGKDTSIYHGKVWYTRAQTDGILQMLYLLFKFLEAKTITSTKETFQEDVLVILKQMLQNY